MGYIVSSAEEIDYKLNWMLYGLPGSGKTALGATLQMHEDTTRVLILSIEGGIFSLKDMDWEKFSAPAVIHIDSLGVLEEVYFALVGNSKEFAGIQTVVVDSLTELAAKDLESTVRRNLTKVSRTGKRRESVDDAWLEDRGEVTSRQARLIRGFRDMQYNFVATAHPRFTYMKDSDGMPRTDQPPLKCEPGFGERLRQHLCGYMDYVWYMKEGDGTYCDILTRSRGPYYAKSRNNGWERFGEAIRWPKGTPLLADVWNSVIHDKPFPGKYKAIKVENKENVNE